MARGKRKRAIVESDSESKDSEDGLLRNGTGESDVEDQNEDPRTVGKQKHNTQGVMSDDTATPASLANATVINAADHKDHKRKPSKSPKNSILSIKEKDQQLDRSCTELRNAIISKTQVLLDNELRNKTSKVLTGCSVNIERIENENVENTTPSVRINIGKNEQILMAGCGEKLHPVQINSMSKSTGSIEHNNSQDSNHNGSDYSQSIASTPKKSNIETLVDKSTGKTSKQIIKIPVARLFSDINPDNSMSEMSPVPAVETLRSPVFKGNNSNFPRISNDLNATSPILSQGIRKNRISRLSLKRKSTTNETKNPRVSTNESFVNRPPLTSSSFIEGPEKTCNKSKTDQHTKTIILEDKSESSANQKTINLDDNENDTNTINIDHSSDKSSMEITTISARTPIVRKPFQQVIHESFRFDLADIPGTQRSSIPNGQSINANESSNKKTRKSNSESIEKINVCQDDCSDNTVKTSLDVNTSLDDVSLAERVTHKENRKPNPTKQPVAQTLKNNTGRESRALTTMRSSLRVNTSLDSVHKSSDGSKADSEPEKRNTAQLQPPSSSSDNQEKQDSKSHQPSNGTVRSSMQVNTSLDSVQKSPNAQEPLNYQKILSMVQEASSTDNSQTLNLQCRSSDNDSGKESTPLAERIQNISASKNKQKSNEEDSSENERLESGKSKSNLKRKSHESGSEKSKVSDKSKSKSLQKDDAQNSESDTTVAENDTSTSKRRKSARKSDANSTNESSVVEATPFPASRSLLVKTIIKNNIAMNTLNPRKLEDDSDDDGSDGARLTLSKNTNTKKPNSVHTRKDTIDDHSSDTVAVDTSDESANESNEKKKKVVIDDSTSDTTDQNKSKRKRSRKLTKRRETRKSDSSDEEEDAKKKMMNKRKLYPLRENSQISFSPAEMTQPQPDAASKDVKRKKRRKMTQKKQDKVKVVEPDEECDHAENEISIPKPAGKKKTKPRKIKSKKFVVKKVTNLTLLDNMLENDEEPPAASTSRRSSLRDFDLRSNTSKEIKSHKIVIVMTGHDKDDRDLVKNVVKALGSAILQANVTPRTTHVISSGVRTINLLKGIIRGCWLLPLDWALKSLEKGKWLDPSPYEMSHFAKAVQINRRDRHIFGKAYVPELFITCGPIYIENGTTPPASMLKELVKTAGGRITDDPKTAKVVVGLEGLKENWILDSITTGEIQPFEQYSRN